MGNSLYLIIFSLFCNSYSFAANEAIINEKQKQGEYNKPSYTKKMTTLEKAKNWQRSDETPEGTLCEIKYADLDYVGIKLGGEPICISAWTDQQAALVCANTTKPRVINPANPQYTDKGALIGGTRTTNPRGYYYCVEKLDYVVGGNNKGMLCRNAKTVKSEYRDLEFKWLREDRSTPAPGEDANCYCGEKGSSVDKLKKCETEQDLAEVYNDNSGYCVGEPAFAGDKGGSLTNRLHRFVKDETGSTNLECKCKAGSQVEWAPEMEPEKCNPESNKPQTLVNENEPDPKVKECVDDFAREEVDLCNTSSTNAKSVCDPKKQNDNKEMNQAIDGVSQIYTTSKAGSGAQEDCFKGALVANVGKNYLNEASDACKNSRNSCVDQCTSSKVLEKYEQKCQELMRKDGPPRQATQDYYDNKKQEISDSLEAVKKICENEVKTGEMTLNSMLNTVGNALASSLKCTCQLSSTGVAGTAGMGGCNSIPSAANCAASPSAPGCSVYGSLDICTPGRTYDAHLCACQMDPKGAGCPGGGASGGLSSFASGTKFNNSIPGAGSGSVVAGNLKGSNFSLPGGGGDTEGSGLLNANGLSGGSAAAGAGGSAGGGGGGAGFGSGGEAGAGKAAAGAGEERGFGALFGKAKSFLSKTFGGGKGSKGKGNGRGGGNGDPNANSFRPTRGIASKTGMGTKNQDIWLMMNKCFMAETCQNNNNNFLDAALKHK